MERLSKIEYSKLTDEQKLERKRQSKKLWNDKNKEYNKLYVEQNRKKIRENHKRWTENNREHKLQLDREYHKLHPKSQYTICKTNWKKRNVLDTFDDNYQTLYIIFKSTKFCDECAIELNTGKNEQIRCLDHCHKSGYFRNILCKSCNTKRQ